MLLSNLIFSPLLFLAMSTKLGFSEWPFRTLPDEDFVRVWCGRNELKERLDGIFKGLFRRPMFQIYLVYGDFGAGKTHSIKHMLNKYRERAKLVASELEYDVTIRTFRQLHQALMSRLNFEVIQDWSNPPAKGSWHDFERFVAGVRSDDPEKQTIAMRWFTGEEKGKRALSSIGIRSPADNVDTAIRAFSHLTKLAGINNSAVVLFIDEFQHVDKLNKNWRERILNGLTKLVNSSPRHFCLIVSFRLRMPMKILSIIPTSMTSRFSADPFVEIRDFSREEAEEFMKCLLREFRTREVDDPHFPFTSQSFDVLLDVLEEKRVAFNPRSIMKIFGYTAERFEDAGHDPPISGEFAKVTSWSYRA